MRAPPGSKALLPETAGGDLSVWMQVGVFNRNLAPNADSFRRRWPAKRFYLKEKGRICQERIDGQTQ